MRPTKLLTISAIAGLSLISYGRSAQAAPVLVNLVGSVDSSCTLAVTKGGTLRQDSEPATDLVAIGDDRGTVVVKCNDSSKSLRLAINSISSSIPSGTATIRSTTEAGGATPGTSGSLTTVPIERFLTNPTDENGETVRVQAKIKAPANKLLKAGVYLLVVDASITP